MKFDSEKYSPLEKQIAHLLEKGYSRKMISFELGNSYHTVRTEIQRMYLKAQVHSVTQFVHRMHMHPELF